MKGDRDEFSLISVSVHQRWKFGTTDTVASTVDVFGTDEISSRHRQRNAVLTFSGCLSS